MAQTGKVENDKVRFNRAYLPGAGVEEVEEEDEEEAEEVAEEVVEEAEEEGSAIASVAGGNMGESSAGAVRLVKD